MPEKDPRFARFLYELARALAHPNAEVGFYTPQELLESVRALRAQRDRLDQASTWFTADLEDEMR